MQPHDALNLITSIATNHMNHPEVRIGAIEGLGHAGGHPAREALGKIAADVTAQPAVRAAACAALGKATLRP